MGVAEGVGVGGEEEEEGFRRRGAAKPRPSALKQLKCNLDGRLSGGAPLSL